MRMKFWVALAAIAAASAARAADVEHGKQLFQACAACHGDKAEGNLGPDLTGAVGRKAGSRDDFRYSAAMMRAGFVWDEEHLRAFVHQPRQVVKGTRMPFEGLPNEADVDDVVAYLATLK